MAIVLFEGFERPFNPDVWTLTRDPAQIADILAGNGDPTGVIWGYSGRGPQPSGGAYIGSHNNFNKATMVAVFPPQTGKTIYLGVGMSSLRAARQDENLGPESRLPIISFRAANGAEQIVIGLEHSATDPTYDTFGAYALHVPTSTYAHYDIPALKAMSNIYDGVAVKPLEGPPNNNSFVYVEVEITANNTVAIRMDGQYLFTNGATAASFASISPIAQIEFYSARIDSRFIDDMYLLNNDGTAANSWLGMNTYVLPLHYPWPATVAEWTSVPEQSVVSNPETGDSNVVPLTANDSDASYISTSTFPRTQLYQVTPSGNAYQGWNYFYDQTAVTGSRVLGMNFWTKARKTTQDSAYKFVYAPAASSTTTYDLSSSIPVTAINYENKPIVYVDKNPATDAAWTIADIYTDGLFGVQSVNPT